MPRMMLAALLLALSGGAGFGQQQVGLGGGATKPVGIPAPQVSNMLSAPFSNLSDMNTHSACLRHRDNDGKFSGQWAACTAYEAAWATKAAATTAAAVSALSSVTDAEDSAALLRLQSPP